MIFVGRSWSVWMTAGLIATVSWSGPSAGSEFFAAPSGTPTAAGTLDDPWDLATALGQAKVRPGDTVALRGGDYVGEFVCTLRGTHERPIVVRPYGIEHARLDVTRPGDRPPQFLVQGAHTQFRDLEFFSSDPRRRTTQTGSWPPDILRGGIVCKADHAAFINCVIHDLSTGVGFWSEGEAGLIEGCLIYNNGWSAPDRGHGHGIYTQNARGTKRIVDNIIFHQFGNGIQAYGSEKAKVEGYEFVGNILFDNGALHNDRGRTANLLVGGNQKAARIVVEHNFGYHTGIEQTCAQFGYGAICDDLTLRGNVWGGFVRILPWERMIVADNEIVGRSSLVELHLAVAPTTATHQFNNNRYFAQERRYPPLVARIADKQAAGSWSDWQHSLNFDADGSFTFGRPQGAKVVVRPSRWQSGRGHIVVFNWDLAPEVEVDLSTTLRPGQRFRIVSAKHFYGPSIMEGVYDGKPIRLPMHPVSPAAPIGLAEIELPKSEPEFGAFVVIPTE